MLNVGITCMEDLFVIVGTVPSKYGRTAQLPRAQVKRVSGKEFCILFQ